jgi:hypothetical protein
MTFIHATGFPLGLLDLGDAAGSNQQRRPEGDIIAATPGFMQQAVLANDLCAWITQDYELLLSDFFPHVMSVSWSSTLMAATFTPSFASSSAFCARPRSSVMQ